MPSAGDNPSGPRLFERVSRALRTRNYSPRTEETYRAWVRDYVRFHRMRHPEELGTQGVNAFLTHLAVDKGHSAATQSEARAALMFLWGPTAQQRLPRSNVGLLIIVGIMVWALGNDFLRLFGPQGARKGSLAPTSGVAASHSPIPASRARRSRGAWTSPQPTSCHLRGSSPRVRYPRSRHMVDCGHTVDCCTGPTPRTSETGS